MKPGLRHWLEINLVGMNEYWEDIQQIEILFKQNRTSGNIQKRVVWENGVESDSCRRGDGNTLLILWSREETHLFQENEFFYMDIRPTLTNGLDLCVEPVKIKMTWTLFEDEESNT